MQGLVALVKAMPDVPTMKESGLPDLVIYGWQGVFAPAATAPAQFRTYITAEQQRWATVINTAKITVD